jgi:hypothetical protein
MEPALARRVNKIFVMSNDVAECLEGLRDAYSASPTARPQSDGTGFELTLDGDDHGDDHGDDGDDGSCSAQVDPDISIRRVSVVEESLYEVLRLDENQSVQVDETKLPSIAYSVNQAKKLPLSHKPHSFPCTDTYKALPAPPSVWPQRPLMIRPTPYTSTKVIGIVGCSP